MPLKVIQTVLPISLLFFPSIFSFFFFFLAFICAIQVAVDVTMGIAFHVALANHPAGHYAEAIDMMVREKKNILLLDIILLKYDFSDLEGQEGQESVGLPGERDPRILYHQG
jgi:hypothetical protein